MEWIDYITSNTSKSLRCTINLGEYTNHRRFEKEIKFLTDKSDYVNKDHCIQETHLNFFLFYLYNSSYIRRQNRLLTSFSPTENISSPTWKYVFTNRKYFFSNGKYFFSNRWCPPRQTGRNSASPQVSETPPCQISSGRGGDGRWGS